MILSEMIEVQSCVRSVWENVFLNGVQYNPLTGRVGGWMDGVGQCV